MRGCKADTRTHTHTKQTHTFTHAHTHTYTHTHSHTRTHTHTRTHARTHTHTKQTHSHIHTHTHIHAHTHKTLSTVCKFGSWGGAQVALAARAQLEYGCKKEGQDGGQLAGTGRHEDEVHGLRGGDGVRIKQ